MGGVPLFGIVVQFQPLVLGTNDGRRHFLKERNYVAPALFQRLDERLYRPRVTDLLQHLLHGSPDDAIAQMAEMGLFGITVSEEY
ncbi:MAG: hypothetical protein QF519_06355, partial [Candidatus Poseidoniia archaeon]|nr:hypothetical protein [Candidatus Poseidoniia archaeon]